MLKRADYLRLWGMAGVQVYYYYNVSSFAIPCFAPELNFPQLCQDYPRDEWWIKVLVGLVYATDTTSQALISQICYTYLVTNYANPTFLAHMES